MKAITGWNFRPYTELYKTERGSSPYICRLAPKERGFMVDFIDNSSPIGNQHKVFYRKRGEGDYIEVCPQIKKGGFGTITIECEDLTDFEVFVERNDGARSSVRLVRTGFVPGTVINYLHPDDDEYAFSGHYLCSPSLIKLDNGRLLASMDVFAGNQPQNLTLIYYSDDNGSEWNYLTELFPCFWGKLFISGGDLYMLGVTREYGDLLIGRSDDGGANWTTPTVLFRGSSFSQECGLHRAPMPVEISHGRVMTDVQYGAWSKKIFCDAVLSAPEGSDLTDPKLWVCSEFFNPKKHPDAMLPNVAGGIEGNIVTAPDGTVYDILRYADGKSLMLKFDPENPEREPEFAGYIDFPATTSKVDILYDNASGYYISLVSYNLSEPKTLRNLLSLVYSADLREWKLAGHIIDYRDADPKQVAFQYIDFIIDGDDILFQSRTAFNGAKNYHDTNYATFHKISDFRKLFIK
jgi:hypothetical protein